MGNSQVGFEYTEEVLVSLEKYLSPERLAAYHSLARGDKLLAYLLYEKNTELSEALYGVVQGLEITLRNAVHNEMCKHVGSPDWYDRIAFLETERAAIDEAKESIKERPAEITSGRIVAELTFGFWTKLMGGVYEKSLWVPFLRNIWPLWLHGKRKIVHERLVNLKTLRNRIAHHERIVGKRDLKQDYADLLEAIGWLSKDINAWVEHTNCFEERYEKKITRPKPEQKSIATKSL